MQNGTDMEESENEAALVLPAECSILPLFGTVIYPHTVTPLAISQPGAVQLVDEVLADSGLLLLVALRAEHVRPVEVGPEQCYHVGTVALIHRLLRLPDNTLRIAAEGIERVRVTNWTAASPHLRGQIEPLVDGTSDPQQVEQLLQAVIDKMRDLAHFLPVFTDDVQVALANEESPQRLTYLLAMSMAAHSSVAERQALLEEATLLGRLRRLDAIINSALGRTEGRPPEQEMHRTSLLQRRPELRDLPLVREALALGQLEGMRSVIETLLHARFGDHGELAALLAQLQQVDDQQMLMRLAVVVSGASRVDEISTLLREP